MSREIKLEWEPRDEKGATWLEATNVPVWIDGLHPEGVRCRIIIAPRPQY